MKDFLQLKRWSIALLAPLLLAGCGSDDGAPQVVTQLNLVFTPEPGGNGTETLRFQYQGDAIDQNVISKDDIVLSTTTIYKVELFAQSTIGISPIDLTSQIRDEAEEWQIFYRTQTTPTIANWSYRDIDQNGLPIGLVTQTINQGAGSGTLTITINEMRVRDDGVATKVSGFGISDGASAPGETKINVTFNLSTE